MNNSKVLLKVEDFRAIGKAEIKLDGITVVAGVNGCGKSTLSKLLYWVYRGATDFKVLADAKLQSELNIINPVLTFIFNLGHIQIRELLINSNTDNDREKFSSSLSQIIDLSIQWEKNYQNLNRDEIISLVNNFKFNLEKSGIVFSYENAPKYFWDILNDSFKANKKILDATLKLYEKTNPNNKNIFDVILTIIIYFFNSREEYLVSKPRLFLDNKIQEVFHIKNLPQLLEISENKLPIFITNNEYINTPYWIDNVIYIDTPMFFQNSGTEHWNDVNEKLKKRPEYYNDKANTKEIDTLIKNEILTGQAEIKFNELNGSFTFITPTGAEIDLSDSATGIKAFAVLDFLLKNKSINDKTLLILDEPEAHLHPQWVIEFGRLLTLIHKYIGAKVFVATHSPDMVQALRYIPNKENIGERVNFYLAKTDENKNSQFIYQDLNGKIDDIFSSFNISLDKLEKYGED